MAKSIDYVNNGDDTATLTIEWTGSKTKLDLLGAEAGEHLHTVRNGNEPEWSTLSNQEKLDVLLDEVVRTLKSYAHSKYKDDAVETTVGGLDTADERYDD